MSICQRLIKIIRKSGLIRETNVHAFANRPWTSNASYNTVNDGLYMSTKAPQSRWLVSKIDRELIIILLKLKYLKSSVTVINKNKITPIVSI